MRKLVLFLFLGSTFYSMAQSGEKWTLQKCVDHAIENNITIAQNQLQGDIQDNNLKAAKFSRYPNLNASGNHNYNIGRTIDPFTNTFSNQTIQSNSFSLSAGVLLYGGNQINNSIKSNELGMLANAKTEEVITNQISLSVATTYLQILKAEENLKLARNQQELTKVQLERALILVKEGSANQSTSLNLEAQLANDNLQIVLAKNAIQLAYNSMINLLQLDVNTAFEIEVISTDVIPEMPTESVSQLYDIALGNMPEVEQGEIMVTQAKVSEKIAEASILPSLSAYGNVNSVYSESGREAIFQGYEIIPIGITETSNEVVFGQNPIFDYQTNSFGKQVGNNLGQSVGLSLSVPIFNGYRNKANIENAKINTKSTSLNLESTKNQLKADVTSAYTSLLAAKATYDAALINEEAQEKNYAFSKLRFEEGLMQSADYLLASSTYNQAQINTLNSRYEYIFRNLIIQFYKGNEISIKP